MSSRWTIPPQESRPDYCYQTVTHGSGQQLVHYRSKHANVSIVDSGGNIFFRLPVADRARPGHRALGFYLAQFDREGTYEEDTGYAKNSPHTGCDPPPGPFLRDQSGCGGYHIPYDAQPLVDRRHFMPGISAFVPSDLVKCPVFNIPSEGAMPQDTRENIGVAEVRRVLGHRHGKLIIHGSQRWHSDITQGLEVIATTTVTWKAILIRAE